VGAIPGSVASILLNATLGTTTWTGTGAPVPPMFLHLTSNAPTSTTAGTPISGTGYSAASILFNSASAGATTGPTSGQGAISWTNGGVSGWTVTGAEIWDSAGTPVRWWYGLWNSGVAISVPASATFQVNVGGCSVSLA
jgi:hypothetical protein